MHKFLAELTSDGAPWAWVAGGLAAVGSSVGLAVRWLVGQNAAREGDLALARNQSEQRYGEMIMLQNRTIQDERERTERVVEALVGCTNALRAITTQIGVLTTLVQDSIK